MNGSSGKEGEPAAGRLHGAAPGVSPDQSTPDPAHPRASSFTPDSLPPPALSVRRLSKVYRVRAAPESRWISLLLPRYISASRRLDHWALRDVSFDVPRGRKLGLIGENGSGKSTLLKIIAGLVKPTSGEVVIEGNVLPLLELGAGFHPELSGWENVFLQGAVLGLSRDQVRDRLPEIVAFAELADFMDTPVKYYSAGMFVRLAFSVAIHCNPDILLVDEILSVGDPAFQEKSFHKMMEFVGGGRTLILVSHSLYAVREICDEALWLDEGRIREHGPARDVIHSYIVWNHERIKQFDTLQREGTVCRLPAPSSASGCRIAAIRFSDSTGAPCSRALSGGPLQIELDCECEKDIADVGCRIVWRSRHDTAILQLDSLAQGQSLQLPRGASVLRIGVEALAVRQATYDLEAQLFHRPAGCAAALLAEARSRLDVVNPDGAATNFFLNVDWRFELAEGARQEEKIQGEKKLSMPSASSMPSIS